MYFVVVVADSLVRDTKSNVAAGHPRRQLGGRYKLRKNADVGETFVLFCERGEEGHTKQREVREKGKDGVRMRVCSGWC